MKKLVLLILLALPFSGFASTKISVQNGLWSNPNIWSPVGVPQLSDDTIIVATSVNFNGQNIYFGNSLFRIAMSGSLIGGAADTLTFGGNVLQVNGYTAMGVIIVGASDSVVINNQLEVNEMMTSGTVINYFWICAAIQLTTSDNFINNGSVTCGNWINSGNVSGNQGRFCIAQNFINSDQIAGNIDICDASPGGLGDVNVGTIAGSVTNCAVGPCSSCIMPGFEEYNSSFVIRIAPNPVTSVALLTVEAVNIQPDMPFTFFLTDVQGRIVKSISFTGNSLVLGRTGIDSGLYFYSLILPDHSSVSGKILLE